MQANPSGRATPEQVINLARQRQAEGKLDEARGLYEKVLQQIPYQPESMTMLASIAYQQDDEIQAEAYLDRAIQVYRQVLAQAPGNTAARAPLCNLLLARNRRDEAEALITDLNLQINPVRATPEQFMDRRRSGLERGLPSVLINTIPKSASESIWNKLAEGLGLAQCHISMGLYPDCCLVPSRVDMAAQGGLVAKEHIPATPYNLQVLAQRGLKRIIFHVRDPRQATLSWAHFVHDDVAMRLMAPIWRKVVPPVRVLRGDLSGLIDWCIDSYLPQLVTFIQGWTELRADSDQDIKVLFLNFEAFLRDETAYFDKLLAFAGIDPKHFLADAQAEVVHMRKGLVDEWREAFSKEQRARAWKAIPEDLAESFGWTA